MNERSVRDVVATPAGHTAPEAQEPRRPTSVGELRARLLDHATALTGLPAAWLVEDDGDVEVRKHPFWIWGRIARDRTEDGLELVVVALPLMDVRVTAGLPELLERTLVGKPVVFAVEGPTIQLFRRLPTTVLDRVEDLRSAISEMDAIGSEVIAAVQPRAGGLTPQQALALLGWRGHDGKIEADLRAALGDAGGDLLAHGWNPDLESLPLLMHQGPPASGFVTLATDGSIRLRSRVPGRRDGVRGVALTIRKLDPAASRIWAGRLGVKASAEPLRLGDVQALGSRTWAELTEAANGLASQAGDGWQSMGGQA